jgi:hypothetical protein
MLPGKSDPKKRVGGGLSARTINSLFERVARLERMGATTPLRITQTPGGPVFTWDGAATDAQYFLPKTAPIPAATGTPPNLTLGKGKATMYYRDTKSNRLKSRQKDHDVYNWAPAAVGSTTRFIVCVQINGDWTVVAEACS